MEKFEVIVGNIGTVYSGTDREAALAEFKECIELSKAKYGRFGSEQVTLWEDGEPIKEIG